METNQNLNDEQVIDLGELFRELLNKALIIILVAMIGALGGFYLSKTVMTPEYTSTAKLYVMARSDSDSLTTSDLQTGTYLTNDYSEIIQSRHVAETVIAHLNLTDSNGEMMGYEDLLEMISVSIPDDSRVIDISVSDDDPYDACDIASEVLEVSIEQIQDVMDIETINVVETANIPLTPDSPNTMRNALYGGVIGAFAAIVIILVVYMTNDSIRTSDDVERYLGLSTLGKIPFVLGDKKSKPKKRDKVVYKHGGAKR